MTGIFVPAVPLVCKVLLLLLPLQLPLQLPNQAEVVTAASFQHKDKACVNILAGSTSSLHATTWMNVTGARQEDAHRSGQQGNIASEQLCSAHHDQQQSKW